MMLRKVNFVMILVALGLCVYNFKVYTTPRETFTDRYDLNRQDVQSSKSIKVAVLPQTKDIDYYKRVIAERDLFEQPWEKEKDENLQQIVPPVVAPVVVPGKPEVPDLSKLGKILGILLDADPKVVINDLTTRETLFLSVGEEFHDTVLKEILVDKVIFSFGKEKIELEM